MTAQGRSRYSSVNRKARVTACSRSAATCSGRAWRSGNGRCLIRPKRSGRSPNSTARSKRPHAKAESGGSMIRKLKSGKYRLYSRKKDPKTGKRKNLGTFATRAEAEKHERAVQYFKHKG